MRNFLFIFLVLFCSTLFALEVIFNPDGSITVIGEGGVTTEVVTNYVGGCTNCIRISKAQALAYKEEIIDEILDGEGSLYSIQNLVADYTNQLQFVIDQISTFQRYDGLLQNVPHPHDVRTNFLYSLTGVQRDLTLDYWTSDPVSHAGNAYIRSALACTYANGIYDYGNQVVSPQIGPAISLAQTMSEAADYALQKYDSVYTTVNGIPIEDCCTTEPPGGGGGGSCTPGEGCPCQEILEVIKDYVESLDDNLEDQLDFINNDYKDFLSRADSYALTVSRSLYQNGTIKVDNGLNHWTNVYLTGHSDLYNYDKSNVLQRIELLLYGLAFPSTVSNLSAIADSPSSELRTVMDNTSANQDTFEGSTDDLKDDVEELQDKLGTLFRAMNFFGNSRLQPFALNDPFEAFGYDFEVTAEKVDTLSYLQSLVSNCMRIFYFAVGVIYCVWFWYVFIRFAYRLVMSVFRFLNMALS